MNVLHLKKISKLLLIVSFIALAFSSCTSSSSYTIGKWNNRSDLDGSTRSGAASFKIGNDEYICCGYNGTKRLCDLWKYDAEHDSWVSMESLPDEAARSGAIGFSANGKGYITTGYNGTIYMNDTWEFDPSIGSKGTWTKKADYPGVARTNALAFTLTKDNTEYGYVGTGYDGLNCLKDFYRYDSTSDKWEIMGETGNTAGNGFSGKKRQGGSSFVINNIAYVCCGEANGYIDDFYKFDPSTGLWTQLRYISNYSDDSYDDNYAGIVRSKAVTFVIDGKAYLTTGSNGTLKTDYWVYNPTTDLWTGCSDDSYTPFKGSARQSAIGFSVGSKGYVVTGSSSSVYFDDLWELSPYENTEE